MVGSVSARLSATLADANGERDKYVAKAKLTGLALNIAIGLQVLLGSLTTGLSAVATQGKSVRWYSCHHRITSNDLDSLGCCSDDYSRCVTPRLLIIYAECLHNLQAHWLLW